MNESRRSAEAGFTLIELMISLVLGLLVVAAASGLFLSNRRVFASTNAVNRIQENGRAAFEILSRDIREAGGNPCGAEVVNLLKPAERAVFEAGWNQGVIGTENGDTVPDSMVLSSTIDAGIRVDRDDVPNAVLRVSSNAGFAVNDIVMVCDPKTANIFKVTQLPNNGLGHHPGNGGNEDRRFQVKQEHVGATPGGADGYCFTAKDASGNNNAKAGQNCSPQPSGAPASVVRVASTRWEVADNANGGKSLYRTVFLNGNVQNTRDEIAAGVVNMQLLYKLRNSDALIKANAVADWTLVNAIQVTLTLEPERGTFTGKDLEGTQAGKKLQRTLSTLVAMRNREGIL